ncbi:MAG TPA: arsenate reductase ArsC [Nitrososphaeraceae archaeon]|jgi:protein-tyrosine-phosphatase|nr:arsenate reductase ArsC [Nitrososphaeraceae archaeon]
MKFFKREPLKSILFVCVENAGRSQMAEGFFNKYAPKGYDAISAGTKPISQINPIAIEVMKEVGIEIGNQKSKEVTEDMIRNSSNIVNMGCIEKESCPTLFLQNFVEWNIEDPRDKPIAKVREIRDVIDQRVKELVTGLKTHQ